MVTDSSPAVESADARLSLLASHSCHGRQSFAAARSALEGWQRVQQNSALLKAILPVLEEEARALPNDEMRWYRLGAARDVSGDVPGAVEAYARMVALHPLSIYIRRRLDALRKQLPKDPPR